MVYKVELLSKEKWKNYILDNGYRSEEYYDVELSLVKTVFITLI